MLCKGLVMGCLLTGPHCSQEIVGIAKATIPGIKTFSLPQGLQVEKGPDAVVEYIKENIPALLDS